MDRREKVAKERAIQMHALQSELRRMASELGQVLADLQGFPLELRRAMAAARFAVKAQQWVLDVCQEHYRAAVDGSAVETEAEHAASASE